MIDQLPTSQIHGPRPSRRRPSRIVREALSLAALAVLAAIVPTAARAAIPVEIENLRVGFGADNVFKIGSWTPVWIQLKGGPERFSGYMDVVASDDDGMPTAFRQAVDVPAGETRRFSGYIRPGGRDSDVTIRFYSESGRWLGEREQARIMPVAPRSVMPYESLVLAAGQPQGIDQIPAAAGFQQAGSTAANSGDAEIVLTRLEIDGDRVPGRWYGFDAARAVVLDTSDRATLDMISGLRGQALVEWIKRGGHLVVSVGANWQAVRDSVLGPVLPAVPAGQERVQSLEALDTFAGASKSITPPQTPRQMITKLEQLDERGGKALSSLANLPVIVRGSYGFGRVTLIGVDVDQKIFSDWPDRGLFWIRALDLKRSRPANAANTAMPVGARFYASGVTDLASQLRVALEQFPRVKLIPFGWVAFLIFLYVLAIGPGDYLFLKRVLKRMELTWITFPAIVVGVSLLAYSAAYRLKGNDLLVNKVDVVDVDQVSGLTRGRSWATLFSPQNRDYGIGFLPTSLEGGEAVAPAVLVDSANPPRPDAGTEVVTSWFSVPENQFGAMGGANRRFSFGGGGYSYEPVNTAERLANVRIPIWSTKTVSSRWFGQAGPVVESELQPVGADRLAGSIVNRLSYPLEDAVLAFGKQVYTIGKIAPGQTVNIQLTNDRNLSGLLKDREKHYFPDNAWDRNIKLDRGDLMLAVMFHESEASRTNERALGNATLHDLDLSGQLALQRPMLVARVDRPAARLALENAPSEPKVDQTTMLRVILPLNQPKRAANASTR
jgi:hypothetical protein